MMTKYLKNVYNKREKAMDAFFIYPSSNDFMMFDFGKVINLVFFHFRFYSKIVSSYIITI